MNLIPKNEYLLVQQVQPDAVGKIELLTPVQVPQKEAIVLNPNNSHIVKEGDRICMRLNAGSPVLVDGKAMLFIEDKDIFCVMEA